MALHGIFGSAYAGLRAQQEALNNISHNVANASTLGYKPIETQFSELVSNKKSGGGVYDPGGFGALPVFRQFNQREGNKQSTGNPFDVAIAGEGLFITSPSFTERTDLEYTAAGSFKPRIQRDGTTEQSYLVDDRGNYVMGWPFNVDTQTYDVDTSGANLQPLRVDFSQFTTDGARITSRLVPQMNLPSGQPIGQPVNIDFPVYDGSGGGDNISDTRSLAFSLTRTAENSWQAVPSVVNGTITQPAAPIPLTFNSQGVLQNQQDINLSVTWDNPRIVQPISVSTVEVTQFLAANVSVFDVINNGIPGTALINVAAGQNGNIVGLFASGESQPIGRLAVAEFNNIDGLLRAGETHYKASQLSGDARFVDPAAVGRAQILPNTLENSAVDLNIELTNMIIVQRSYSSISSAFKVANEILQSAIQLK